MAFDADEEILQDFLVEAGEILEKLSEQLVELEVLEAMYGGEGEFSCDAVAREAAIGPLAFARLINNEQAAGLVNLGALEQHHLWVLGVMSVLVIVPAMWHAKMVRKRMGRQDTPVH